MSLQARLLSAYIRMAIKPRSRQGFDVVWARRVLGDPPLQPRVSPRFMVEPIRLGGAPGEAVRPSGLERPRRTILFLHGGGYYFGSAQSHRAITFALAQSLQARVVAVNYRLAPEHPYPAALDDAVAAVLDLYAGVSPHDLALCGDSAGGGLALSTLLRLRDAGYPLPACAALFSPWTDLAATGPSIAANDKRDALFHGDCIAADARHYLAGRDPRDPGASPLYADLAGLPPLLCQVSGTEVLLDDSLRLVRKARLAGVAARCQIWSDLPHVWQLYPGFLPEARQALNDACRFIRAYAGSDRARNNPLARGARTPARAHAARAQRQPAL
jgi:monoterpene epsilon-lactone hydrolase